MGLKVFHIVFVTAASLLSFLFSGWCWRYAAENQAAEYRTLGAVSLGAGLAMIAYGFWFWRKINPSGNGPSKGGAAVLLLLVWLLCDQNAAACTTCYGDAQGPLIDGARAGVWLLFGLVFTMQAAFATFFVYLWRRGRS